MLRLGIRAGKVTILPRFSRVLAGLTRQTALAIVWPTAAWGQPVAKVFISYQKHDIDLAVRVVRLLTNAGLTVWWDDDLTPRGSWDRIIEREISSADHVLVLWTPNSVQSEWVRIEANYALNCVPSKLVQARFNAAQVPMAFTLRQYVDLDFEAPDRGPSWDRLLAWLGGSAPPPPPPPPPPQPVKSKPDAGKDDTPPRPAAALPQKVIWAPIGLRAALPDMPQWRVFWLFAAGMVLFNLNVFLELAKILAGPAEWVFMALFGLPLSVFGWKQQGRLVRGVFLLAIVPACYFLAIQAAVKGSSSLSWGLFGAGLIGGVVGSSLSFAAIAVLGGTIRKSQSLLSMVTATIALTVIGGIGLGSQGSLGFYGFLTLYPAWQLVFGYALSLILTGTPPPWHRAIRA